MHYVLCVVIKIHNKENYYLAAIELGLSKADNQKLS